MTSSDQPSEKIDIDVLLVEKRVFRPSEDFVKATNVWQWMEQRGINNLKELLERSQDYEWFWGEMAKDVGISWVEPYDQVVEWDLPWAKWFVGAKYNIVLDVLDNHATSKRKDKVAYIWEGEPEGEVRKLTYGDLYAEVNKLANGLKSLGVKKGDRVSIYLPMIPELPIAMLACAKIGAIHSVVFSG
ncbi:MAG: AMP-binding protein, partial [Candidatus Heimdallarchaeota archaeon]